MITIVTTVFVAFAILFGGAGATAYAMQDSLPDDALYGMKMLGENLRMQMTNDPQAKLALSLEFANRRMQEITTLLDEDEPIPAPTATRHREHLNFALRLAASLEDPDAKVKALHQIRACLEQQERIMVQKFTNRPEGVDPTMNHIRETIRERIRMVDLGLEEPLMLRQRLHQELQDGGGVPPEEPGSDSRPGPFGPRVTPMPDDEQPGYGPGEPANDEPYGPGHGQDETPDPDPNSEGPGSQSGPGEPTQTPKNKGGGNDDPPKDPGSGNGSPNSIPSPAGGHK